MDFKDKVVLVTGSSRGIGKEIVYQFAKCGAKVVINYNDSYDDALLFKSVLDLEFDSDFLMVKADVSSLDEVKSMIGEIVRKYGRIDVLVNNASIAIDSVFEEKSIDDFKRVLDVNLIGTYLVSREASKYMSEGSCIINISSDNAIDRYYPESCDYDASKAGVISLTHNMAKFYSPKIRVNCVCPGWIDTDMNKDLDDEQVSNITSRILLNRFGSEEEVSNLVLFLASSKASFVNDSIIKVNGGVSNE